MNENFNGFAAHFRAARFRWLIAISMKFQVHVVFLEAHAHSHSCYGRSLFVSWLAFKIVIQNLFLIWFFFKLSFLPDVQTLGTTEITNWRTRGNTTTQSSDTICPSESFFRRCQFSELKFVNKIKFLKEKKKEIFEKVSKVREKFSRSERKSFCSTVTHAGILEFYC